LKIAYFSVYRDGGGYSQAALNDILAIEKVGYDIVCRPVRMSSPKSKEQSLVAHLEKKDLKNIDLIIETNLPQTFEKKSDIKTVGRFFWETNTICKTWVDSCNRLDEIWCSCIQQKYACINSNITIPIKILPCSVNLKKYANKPKSLDIPLLKDKCVFLFVGENTRRKNIAGLIRGYYAAFIGKENVVLVIKTSSPGHSSAQTMQMMQKFISDIKKATHIHPNDKDYPPILILTEHLSEEQLAQLHISSNIFVSPSHGEGGNLEAMDAMGWGNPVILSNWGFHPELCYGQAEKYWEPEKEMFKWPGEVGCGWLIPCCLNYCFGQLNGTGEMYTGKELWADVNMPAFVNILKNAYKEYRDGSLKLRGEAAKQRIKSFSHESVGNIIKELLI
jgi:glycosyltransferase involved in cell wall biosynthesis